MSLPNTHSKSLIQWHLAENCRDLPWKSEKDPYKIWLSEILLQQTKAEAVVPYYNKILKHFPTIQLLAAAKEQKIFQLWQGLGYYSRCRNLILTAKWISEENSGLFPNTYEGLLALKGIGPYTASAVASFAFNLPYAVVDGNVYRIIARLLASAIPIDSTEGKKYFQEKATALMDKKNPAIYNQAIMDLGATICKPKNPLCLQCPWHKYCKAFSTKTVEKFPIKSKKLIIKKRHFHYLVFDDGKHLYIRKRIGNDIWKDLHEFALIETDDENIGISFDRNPSASVFQQQLTHQKITAYFYVMLQKVLRKTITEYGLEKVAYENLENYAMPKVILDFLHQNKYL